MVTTLFSCRSFVRCVRALVCYCVEVTQNRWEEMRCVKAVLEVLCYSQETEYIVKVTGELLTYCVAAVQQDRVE